VAESERIGRKTSGAATAPIGIILMVVSSLFTCTGQLMWKLAATGRAAEIVIGFGCYGVGALLMLIAYRFGELSVLQPILGLSYVLSLLAGWTWLGEQITAGRVIGVAAVVAGVAMVARSAR